MFDSLNIVIEFGLGLAGFAGIIVALAGDPRHWTQGERVRVFGLIFSAFLAAFSAFLCLALEHYVSNEVAVRIAAGFLFFVGVVFFPRQVYRTLYVMRQTKENYSRKMTFFVATLSFLIVGCSFSALMGLTTHLFTFFYLGLVLTLLFAALIYVRLLLYRPAGSISKIANSTSDDA